MSAIRFNVHLKDFHKAHKARNHSPNETATEKEFRTIIETMGDILGDILIKTGTARLPASQLILKIEKQKNTYTDKKASKEFKTKIRAFNDHSDGFACQVKLEGLDTGNKKKRFYWFKATRLLGRVKLKNHIRNDKTAIYNYQTKAVQPAKSK